MSPKKTTKKTIKSKSIKKAELQTVYPEQLDVIYTNHSYFSMSPTDLTIDIGIMNTRPVAKELQAVVNVNARVVMSPQHAKVFLSKMKGILESYEKDFGTIRTEPKK